MSEKNDKKQDSAAMENEYKSVEIGSNNSRFSGKTVIEETVVEEIIIEEITVTTKKGKPKPDELGALSPEQITDGATAKALGNSSDAPAENGINNGENKPERSETHEGEIKQTKRETKQTNGGEIKQAKGETKQTNDSEIKQTKRETKKSNDSETKQTKRETKQTNGGEIKQAKGETKKLNDGETKKSSDGETEHSKSETIKAHGDETRQGEPEENNGDDAGAQKPKKRKRGGFINNLLLVLIVVLAVVIVFLNVFVMCPVQQESMTPTILDGERVLLLRSKKVVNDEIFVFDSGKKDSDGNAINLIKRAMASGGDRLLFAVSGEAPLVGSDTRIVSLYRDTGEGFELLSEDYIAEPMFLNRMPRTQHCPVYETEDGEIDEAAAADFIITVPDGHFYALGDNRNESNDSRSFGFVQKKTVVGRMKLKLKKDSFAEKFLGILYWDRSGCNSFIRIGVRTGA